MTYMNNLLDVAHSYNGYTHLRLELTTGHLNFIYKDLVMDDLEVHYTLDAIMRSGSTQSWWRPSRFSGRRMECWSNTS